MPTAPSAFPWLGAPQAPGDEPNPPEGGKSLGGRPLLPKEISRYRDTLGQIRAADNTAGRSATRQLERFRPRLICLLTANTLVLITVRKVHYSKMGKFPKTVIWCQIHPSRRAVVVRINRSIGGEGGSYLSRGYLSESERNSSTWVRTHLLRFRSSAR